MIFKAISKHKRTVRFIAAFLALNMVIELVMPLKALALTGGPSQPEVQSFEPVSANQMVDLFTGDFTYNIPLLDVGGYPINISYHAGPGLDEEASWVGLGWNINPGVINRNMRGIPDDFFSPDPDPDDVNNDYVKRVSKMKPSQTYSLNFSPSNEIFSVKTGDFLTLGIEYNNYRGFGFNMNAGNNKGSFPFSINYSSQGGLGVNVSYRKVKNSTVDKAKGGFSLVPPAGDESFPGNTLGGSIGVNVNSRQGIEGLSFGLEKAKWTQTNYYSEGRSETTIDSKANGSASISFLNSSYIPSTQSKSFSLSINLSTELGAKFFGINPDNRIGIGYNYSGVLVKDREEKYPVYGFLNHSKVYQNFTIKDQTNGMAIMDFNANGRNMLTKGQVELPYTTLTYDVLSVTGQGISGIYRPHAGVIGTVYDQRAENIPATPLSLGFDLGVGNTAKVAVDVSLSYFKSESVWWDEDNVLSDHLDYSATRSGADFEQVYYKNAGEKTAVDKTFLNSIDDGIAARPELNKSKLEFGLTDKLITSVNDPTITAPVIRNKRDKRNQVISTLSAKDAHDFGLIKYRSPYAKDHHIGQITVVNPDGSRYIYAQPAYNTLQQEYSFSIANSPVDANGTAWFTHDGTTQDDSEKNNKTLEEFFDFQEIPPYAHSYLLNAVVSPDYMDLTGDGPSQDDNGYYTHIKYKKNKEIDSVYRWRTPYAFGYAPGVPGASQESSTNGRFSATFNKGLHSDEQDDKASYIYGEKEIFYVEKIETKTHMALFFTSTREDGIDVNSNLGQKGTQKLQKLDSIQLYTTNDYYNNPSAKKPLKVVYFKYEYKLCKKIPNRLYADSGKLTLKRIYFKYGNSNAGALSPYVFDYREDQNIYNPDYTYKGYDRWGNYKAPQSGIANDEFPYCEQDKTLADQYASAWSLHKITLPSGGTITVHYEADDYAYVQDKKAMEMFKIAGFGENTGFSNSSELYWNGGFKQNDYVYFRRKSNTDDIKMYLPEPSTIDNKRYLYINAYVKLKEPLFGSGPAIYDFVRCYAEILGSGVCTNNSDYGYIKIKKQPLSEAIGVDYGDINPIAKTSWQFMRLNAPHLVYEGQDAFRGKVSEGAIGLADVKQTAWAIFGYLPELAKAFTGFNTQQLGWGRANEVDLTKSWIRLQSPNQKKIGGGLRVKKILINNEWHGMVSSEESQTLGQIYQYTMYDSKKDGNDNTVYYEISSGVASYEPQLGGDENPHRLPEFYTLKKLASLGQEDYFFHDIPLGESVYPAPTVGYRQVMVRNIKPEEDDDPDTHGTIKRHGTGYTVHKFYTAYEFPVIKEKTTADAAFRKSPITSLLGFSTEIVGASQGFAIEINDMHGKPRGVETFDEYNKSISSTEYKYLTDGKNRLSNTVTTLKKDGTVDKEAIVGYEVEMVVHPRQLKEGSITVRLNTDADVFFAGPIPVITLGIGLGLHGMYKSVRTATATKIINRYGILESVTVKDQSSSVTTKNIAFDDETGEVLLTETTNEYSDNVYNFTYPAHWTVDGMGSAYKNIGAYFTGVNISTSPLGEAVFSIADGEFLTPGDELIADNGSSPPLPVLVWVLDKELISSQYHITFIDRAGNPLPTGTYTMRNIRSGRRNMQTVPVGKIVGKSNPITSGSSFLNVNGEVNINGVLNASAASFSDQWQVYRHDPGGWSKNCEQYIFTRNYTPISSEYRFVYNPPSLNRFPKVDEIVNPFVAGIKGNWRPDYTYVYYDRRIAGNEFQRDQAYTGSSFNSTNTAEDGSLGNFKPFWYVNSGEWVDRGINSSQTNNPWTWNSLATQINPDGVELENKNALNIFSSAIYSYTSKQPLAVTYNAPLRETLYEGFENYSKINYDILYCDVNTFNTGITTDFDDDNVAKKLITTPLHWYFWPTLHTKSTGSFIAAISDEAAHTGKNSLKIYNSSITIPTKIYEKSPNSNNAGLINQYQVNPIDLTDIFSPTPVASTEQKEYVLTYWVKSDDINNAYIEINLNGSTINPSSTTYSNKIEGWIKIEKVYVLTNINANDIFNVKIKNIGFNNAYFDDIRIHPLDANMKSFVYDNDKLRLSASLDENNYATFFEYDEEGNLVRTKRETERGIITINENRQNIRPYKP